MVIDILIAVVLGAVSITMAYLGVHVTLHPTEEPRKQRLYKIGFALCATLAVSLIASQTWRNEKVQGRLQAQLDRIQQNTLQPPEVRVTNNIPPAQVILQPPPINKMQTTTSKIAADAPVATSHPASSRSDQGEPSKEAERFIQKGFSDFNAAIDKNKPCTIRITAPEDTRRGAIQVQQLASDVLRNVSSCKLIGPSSFDIDPDLEKEDMAGTVPGKVVIHAAKDQQGIDKFLGQFSFYLDSKRSYDIPPGTTGNYLWLQFGTGMRWR